MAIYYVSHSSGDDANDGSNWANAVKTIGAASILADTPGDEVRIEKSPDPVSTAVDATFTNAGATGGAADGTIELATALTKNIDMCDANWTDGNGVSTYYTTLYHKQGTGCIGVAKALDVTGKLAYKTLAAELDPAIDFSAFQQISFWVSMSHKQSCIAGEYQLALCSDTEGETVVNTFDIPALQYINSNLYFWHALTLNNAGALGSAIKSIAIYCTTATAAKTIILDDIFAAGADGAATTITLNTLIGKGGADNDGWYLPGSIDGTTIRLNNHAHTTNHYSTNWNGYYGITETLPLYKIDPFQFTGLNTVSENTIVNSGSAGSPIVFNGGFEYDTTNQNGESYYSSDNNIGYFIYADRKQYLTFNNISLGRWHLGYYFYSSNGTGSICDNITVKCNNLTNNWAGINTNYISNVNFEIENCNNNLCGIYNINYAFIKGGTIKITNLNSNGSISGTAPHSEAIKLYFGYQLDIQIDNLNNNLTGVSLYACRDTSLTVVNPAKRTVHNFLYTAHYLNWANFNLKVKIDNLDGEARGTGTGISCNFMHYSEVIAKHITRCDWWGAYFHDCSFNTIKIDEVSYCARVSSTYYGGLFIAGTTDNRYNMHNTLLSNSIHDNYRNNLVMGGTNNSIKNCTIFNHGAGWHNVGIDLRSTNYFDNCNFDTTNFANVTYPITAETISTNIDGNPTAHEIFKQYGLIQTTTTSEHLKSNPFAWKLSPTETAQTSSFFPLFGPISRLYVKTGQKFNFRVWAKRDNTGIDGGIRIRVDGLNGLTTALESAITADADTWQQLEIPFTATTDTLLTIEQFAYGGSTYNLYIDPYQLLGANSFVNGDMLYVPSSEKISTF